MYLADSEDTLDKELELNEDSGRIESIADRVRKRRGIEGEPFDKYLKKDDKSFSMIGSTDEIIKEFVTM